MSSRLLKLACSASPWRLAGGDYADASAMYYRGVGVWAYADVLFNLRNFGRR